MLRAYCSLRWRLRIRARLPQSLTLPRKRFLSLSASKLFLVSFHLCRYVRSSLKSSPRLTAWSRRINVLLSPLSSWELLCSLTQRSGFSKVTGTWTRLIFPCNPEDAYRLWCDGLMWSGNDWSRRLCWRPLWSGHRLTMRKVCPPCMQDLPDLLNAVDLAVWLAESGGVGSRWPAASRKTLRSRQLSSGRNVAVYCPGSHQLYGAYRWRFWCHRCVDCCEPRFGFVGSRDVAPFGGSGLWNPGHLDRWRSNTRGLGFFATVIGVFPNSNNFVKKCEGFLRQCQGRGVFCDGPRGFFCDGIHGESFCDGSTGGFLRQFRRERKRSGW